VLLEVIFWVCVLGIFHSYVLFPVLLSIIAKRKSSNLNFYPRDSPDLPNVSILLAAYNEEKVIAEKIVKTFQTSYPIHKLEFLIGSDASTDATNKIVKAHRDLYSELKLIEFPDRSGKVAIINKLASIAAGEILILTDANVFFDEETIYQLVKHYKNQEIELVGGNILNQNIKRDGIGHAEKTYLSRENKIKYAEGLVWGCMMGVFGGCYSVRKRSFQPVPERFNVDDFYISMQVLKNGGKAILELCAIAYEDVSNRLSEEFRRKVRISKGNFQNLNLFYPLLWPLNNALAFTFLSHKVIRWVGPLLIILTFLCSLGLSSQTLFFKYVLVVQIALMLIPFLDWILKKININIPVFRFISHFYVMNLALLTGFYKYVKGVESNVWKPTER
jgi:cellulose synthase/poly-beta-1,6-N-acetylglucosamine synthase-like glycosyltransferase